jgi:16S rRNA (guanine527-N7)-methyltransferase
MTDWVQQARDLLNVDLSPEQVTALLTVEALLIEWNERMNLTAITEPDAIRVRHFLDSLSPVLVTDLADGVKVVDIGTGAGFPGLPLAVAFPNVYVTLIDSVGKKVKFIQHVIDALGLTNAEAIHARAEEAGQDAAHRAAYDVVLARAVARLPGLMEYMLPLAKVGGRCIAMKGTTAHAEAADAARAIVAFGGKLDSITELQLPTIEHPHYLIAIDKVSATPPEFPRKPGTPTRAPVI